ncbi:MAG TPA: hypothetical protein DCZ91_09830 [Lachnospiraceae bacterium]|nr:hypothetical protein [Lachnospiraceae bacterium]
MTKSGIQELPLSGWGNPIPVIPHQSWHLPVVCGEQRNNAAQTSGMQARLCQAQRAPVHRYPVPAKDSRLRKHSRTGTVWIASGKQLQQRFKSNWQGDR